MLTGELKSKIDRVWEAFWTGGLSNPLTVIEQMTFLLFIKRLDDIQIQREQKAAFLKQPVGSPIFSKKQNELRWSYFKNTDPDMMFRMFTKENGVFDFLKNMGTVDSAFSKYMRGATFMIPTPRLLAQVVDMLSEINMDDRDTKGDVYEYLLSKIASAGQNGQFRTPRHIIKMMVQMIRPTLDDVVCDPAAGTAGFLVMTGEYLRHTFPKELLKAKVQAYFQNKLFMGMEFDPTMIRIGAMNLMLHGIEQPNLIAVDALSESNQSFTEKASIVLANPPFKGSLDKDAIDPKLFKYCRQQKNRDSVFGPYTKGFEVGRTRCSNRSGRGIIWQWKCPYINPEYYNRGT